MANISPRLCEMSLEKVDARVDLIIDTYQDTTKKKTISKGKHLVSLCGINSDETGKLSPNSEIAQFLQSGLIDASQYIGVDEKKEIIENNKKAFPAGHYINKNIQDVFDDFVSPECVNFDTTQMGTTPSVVDAFSNTLFSLTQYVENDIFVLFNFSSRQHTWDITADDVLLKLLDHSTFRLAMQNAHWEVCPSYYEYLNGARRSVKMTGIWFVKSAMGSPPIFVDPPAVDGSGKTWRGGNIYQFKDSTMDILSQKQAIHKALLDIRIIEMSLNSAKETLKSLI